MMSLSNEELIIQYKENHNFLLKRYLNGCDYLNNPKNQTDRLIEELFKIQENIDINLAKLMKLTNITSKEVIEGFELRRTDEQ